MVIVQNQNVFKIFDKVLFILKVRNDVRISNYLYQIGIMVFCLQFKNDIVNGTRGPSVLDIGMNNDELTGQERIFLNFMRFGFFIIQGAVAVYHIEKFKLGRMTVQIHEIVV